MAKPSILNISVIIPTYKRGMILIKSIQCILKNRYPSFEVLVIDQTESHDPEVHGQLKYLDASGQIRWVRLPIPSLPLARNVGLQRAQGDIILYCDDDIFVDPEFIAAHVSRYNDPRVAAVAGRVITPNRTDSWNLETFDLSALASVRGSRPRPGRLSPDGNNESHFDQTGYHGEVEWGQGCNMSFRRSALLEAGGFDERYTGTAIHEEVDAFVRVRSLPHRAVFEPGAWMIHFKHSNGGCRHQSEEIDRLCSTYRNKSLFFWKTGNLIGWMRYTRFQLPAMYSAIRINHFPASTIFRFVSAHLGGVRTAMMDSPDIQSQKI